MQMRATRPLPQNFLRFQAFLAAAATRIHRCTKWFGQVSAAARRTESGNVLGRACLDLRSAGHQTPGEWIRKNQSDGLYRQMLYRIWATYPNGWYYKSAWSANVVIFDSPHRYGHQPYLDFDGHISWTTWKARRDAAIKHPPTGVLLETEANDRYARALGDQRGATYPTGSSWTRELVFLGYRYLLVLDRVKPGKDTTTRRLLHSINKPTLDRGKGLTTIDNGKGRLFCKTLLAEKAELVSVGNPEKAFVHKTRSGAEKSWEYYRAKKAGTQLGVGRVDVTPPEAGGECVYLHVFFPTDTSVTAMPLCSLVRHGENLAVKVGDLAYTFKPGTL